MYRIALPYIKLDLFTVQYILTLRLQFGLEEIVVFCLGCQCVFGLQPRESHIALHNCITLLYNASDALASLLPFLPRQRGNKHFATRLWGEVGSAASCPLPLKWGLCGTAVADAIDTSMLTVGAGVTDPVETEACIVNLPTPHHKKSKHG